MWILPKIIINMDSNKDFCRFLYIQQDGVSMLYFIVDIRRNSHTWFKAFQYIKVEKTHVLYFIIVLS